MNSFFKINRNEHTEKLMKDQNAFIIMTLVAYRANRSLSKNTGGANQYQAFIGRGDFPNLTEKAYRRAKERLARGGVMRFQGAGRGTVATLLNSLVYDINPEAEGQTERGGVMQHECDESATRRAPNKNKEIRIKNKEKEKSNILLFLNQTCKTNFKQTTEKTDYWIDKWFNIGYKVGDFEIVILKKNKEWGNSSRMAGNLKPSTLFEAKFEEYLYQKVVSNETSKNPDDVHDFLAENKQKIAEWEVANGLG